MFNPRQVGPRTLAAPPQNAVWMVDPVLGTWRPVWRRNFQSDIGEGATGYAWMTLGLAPTSIYGRGEHWDNSYRFQQGAGLNIGDAASWAARGEYVDIADQEGLYLKAPPTLPTIGGDVK